MNLILCYAGDRLVIYVTEGIIRATDRVRSRHGDMDLRIISSAVLVNLIAISLQQKWTKIVHSSPVLMKAGSFQTAFSY
jgi:hypothetical protein